jgi:hypothetical protein
MKSIKSSVKVQIDDDDSDLIDEDSLLTEEDLKKPQPPLGKIQDTERWFYAFLWFFWATNNQICM